MGIETYTPKDLHNITTLSNAIKARRVYEDARLEGVGKGKVVVKAKDRTIIANETVAQVWRGMEVGARNELFDAGHHLTVHEVYLSANGKELGSGE